MSAYKYPCLFSREKAVIDICIQSVNKMGIYLLQPVNAMPNTSFVLEILDIISTHCRLFATCLDIDTKSLFGPVAPKQLIY